MKKIILIDFKLSGMVKDSKIYPYHSMKMMISKFLERAQMECNFMLQIRLLIPTKRI